MAGGLVLGGGLVWGGLMLTDRLRTKTELEAAKAAKK
jgi:hypothetical protein